MTSDQVKPETGKGAGPWSRFVRLRKLGLLTLLAFTAKGLVTTSLIVWALISAAD